jgi:NADPH2:quinone reductase
VRAAIVREYGQPPELGEWDEPAGGDGQAMVEVLAGGLNPVDLRIASGTYITGPPPLPYVAGREGVGRLGDETVYFDGPVHPFGSFAERTVIDRGSAVRIPDSLDPALAVCFGIAGLAAWLALEWRAQLQPGETVLVLGASGVVGQIAVQGARLLGAGRVVAAARSEDGLRLASRRGADATVRLGAGDDLAAAFREATGGGADVVVDPLWGEPAAAAVDSINPGGRLVQLGQSAGAQATISSATLRGRSASILGHTNMMAPAEVKQAAYRRMVEHAAAGELAVDVERVALEGAPDAWRRQAESPRHKLVIVP